MKTTKYNPSPLETELADILLSLKNEISSALKDNKILEIKGEKDQDNPDVTLLLEDNDGDKHELVIKIIQRAEE